MTTDAPLNHESPPPAALEAPAPSPAAPPPAPRGRAWSVIALVLALAGAGVALFLVREFLTVTEGGLAKGLFCGDAGTFDCGTVASSDAAWMLGFPVAMWGLVFYVAMTGLALATFVLRPAERAAAAGLGLLLACTALVFDAYLAWVMVAQIGSVCLNCVATYAINLLLALSFWQLDRRPEAAPDTRALFLSWRPALPKLGLAVVVLGGIGAAVILTALPLRELQQYSREETLEFLAKLGQPPEIDMSRFAGLPSRGPIDAPLTIVVAGDFQCHFCRALSAHVERLRQESPRKIRVVFVNAAINSDCGSETQDPEGEDSCWLAEAGACAAEQGKFWQYHDCVFHDIPLPRVTREIVARRLGAMGIDAARLQTCIDSGTAKAIVQRDAALCRELKLESVPSVVINGHARRAGVYPSMLRSVVHAMLRKLEAPGAPQ